MEHRNISGLDALHPFAIRQVADPGAIGAGKGWMDASSGTPRLKIRNETNTGWETPQIDAALHYFATSADRDLFFLGKVGNEYAANLQSGFLERWNQPTAEWLPEGVLGSAGPIVRAKSKRAKGDGVTNDRQAFLDMDAAVAAGGHGVVDPGTYLISGGGTVTLNQHHEFLRGAIVKPTAGTQILILGPFNPGLWRVFDLSLGGTVRYTGNPYMQGYSAVWFGADPTGATDSGLAFQQLSDSIPDYSKIHLPLSAQFKWATAVTWTARVGLELISNVRTGYGEAGCPTIAWTGADGAARMLFVNRCRDVTVSGIKWQMAGLVFGQGAIRAIDCDGYVSGQIGSICNFEHNLFLTSGRKDCEPLCISRTVQDNQEYHVVAWNQFFGTGDFRQYFSGGSITTGTTAFSTTTDTFQLGPSGTYADSPDIGRRFRGSGMKSTTGFYDGYFGAGLVTTLDTTIVAVTNARNATLAAAANLTAANVPYQIGESFGAAIVIGPSANAKKIWIERNQINTWRFGIVNLGSCQSVSNSFGDCEANIGHGPSEPFLDFGTNTEHSRKHIMSIDNLRAYGASTQPAIIDGLRCSLDQVEVGGCYFDLEGTPCSVRGFAWDGISAMPPGSHVFRGDNGTYYTFESPRWDVGAMTETAVRAALGLNRFSHHTITGNYGLPRIHDDATNAKRWLGGGTYFASEGEEDYSVFETVSTGASGDYSYAFHVRSQPKGGAFLGGIRFRPPGDSADYAGNLDFKSGRNITFDMPNHSAGQAMTAHESTRVKSPALAGGSTLGIARAHTIEPLKTTGVGQAFAIDQQGREDKVYLQGHTVIGLRNAGSESAYLTPGTMIGHVDEAGNNLLIEVMYSNGVTVKVATIPLV